MSDTYTCGTCGRTWDHPTPAARCPFEYDHDEIDQTISDARITAWISDDGTLVVQLDTPVDRALHVRVWINDHLPFDREVTP